MAEKTAISVHDDPQARREGDPASPAPQVPTAPPDPPAPEKEPASKDLVAEEVRELARIRKHLLEHPESPGASVSSALMEMQNLRQQVDGAKQEDLGAILHQYDQVANLVDQIQRARQTQQVDPDCPYFARLRIRDEKGTRDLCLGKATHLDRQVRIVDWRNAPISAVFYRYDEGEEFEEELGDVLVEGKVEARRILGIRAGRLERVDAPSGTWIREQSGWKKLQESSPVLAGGAGAAFRARDAGSVKGAKLGTGMQHRADKRLPQIAALIDPEQFQLITRPETGLVVIRGSAGSGKTTVALHRVAYLAYARPDLFKPSRMTVMVWGRALKSYVAHVLPSLGVKGVSVVTWTEWAGRLRQRHFSRLPRGVRTDTPSALARLKLHPGLLGVLAHRVAMREAPPRVGEAIDDFISLLADGPGVAAELARFPGNLLGDRVLEQAGEQMQQQASMLRAWLDGDKKQGPLLDSEDDAILLRLWQLRVGRIRASKRRPLRIYHLVVDEVQDFAPIEVKVALGCLSRERSATLAGDVMQQVMEDTGFSDWEEFFKVVGIRGSLFEALNVSYRSTRQITSFSRALLGDEAEAEPTPRSVREGPSVELLRFTEHGACVAFLASALKDLVSREPLASVALLAPNSHLQDLYFNGLQRADLLRLRRIRNQEFSFEPGIDVADVHDVKGLEFDYVVVLEASAAHYPDTSVARRLLHVAATRAIHQLWITSVGTPAAQLRRMKQDQLPQPMDAQHKSPAPNA